MIGGGSSFVTGRSVIKGVGEAGALDEDREFSDGLLRCKGTDSD